MWVCRGRGKGRGCHSRLGRGSRWRGGRWVISENAPGKGPVRLPGQRKQGIAAVRPHGRVDTNIRKGVAMRNLESALRPGAPSTSLQSILLARPPSPPSAHSIWTGLVTGLNVVRLLSSFIVAVSLPQMQATYRFSSLALRTIFSPWRFRQARGCRCGLRISMLGIRGLLLR